MSDITLEKPTFNTTNMSKRDWALELVRRGAGIVPLHTSKPDGSCSCRKGKDCGGPGKHPIYKGWQLHTLKTEAEVLAWNNENPDANYGVNMAGVGFIIDLDVTDGKNGINNLLTHINAARAKQNKAPVDEDQLKNVTFTVETTSGGLHLYFLHPEPVGNVECGIEGVDIRGVGGQCVGPKSIIYRRDEFEDLFPATYKVIKNTIARRAIKGTTSSQCRR